MKVLKSQENLPREWAQTAVSIGNFDGVHRGHVAILQRLRSTGLPTVVFTFEPHPMQLLCPLSAPERLTWTERKLELLERQNVDAVVLWQTTTEMLRWTAVEFFERILRRQLHATSIVEGSTFTFGRNREGTPERLKALCQTQGLTLEIVGSQMAQGEAISSSRIRRILREGNVQLANAMLTEPYRIRGRIVSGEGRGRKIGFPTANLAEIDTLLPAYGVYAGRAILADGRTFQAAVNLGPNLTFGEETPKVEIHLLDFSEDLYGQELQVEFHTHLRDLTPFSSPEALVAQIQQDVAAVRRSLENPSAATGHHQPSV